MITFGGASDVAYVTRVLFHDAFAVSVTKLILIII